MHECLGKIEVPSAGLVSVIDNVPDQPRWAFFVSHGLGGSDMRHVFLETLSRKLFDRNIAVVRYTFPYRERGVDIILPYTEPLEGADRLSRAKEGLDSEEVLLATSVAAAHHTASFGVPVIGGGWSMSSKVVTLAEARGKLPEFVRGIVAFSYPLYWPGLPEMADEQFVHFHDVRKPFLLIQPGADEYSSYESLSLRFSHLGPHASLRWMPGAFHGFEPAPGEDSYERYGLDYDKAMDLVVTQVVRFGDWLLR